MAITELTPRRPDVDTLSPLALTDDQRRRFDEDGFFLIEDALSANEVEALLGLVDERCQRFRRERELAEDEPLQMRNIVAMDPLFLGMVDHARILPLVVDLMGTNVQLRTSHADERPPQSVELAEVALGAPESFFPWHSDGPSFGWPRVNSFLPFMEMKVGYYLTDLTQPNSGEICVVSGSHMSTQPVGADGGQEVDPAHIVGVNVRPGTALVWRTQLLHALRPNLSGMARRCLYYGYHQRWIRPSDYDRQPAEVLQGCSPVRRQLLGELGTGEHNYSGDDPQMHPISLYWRPNDEDIPLKAWAEERRAKVGS